MDDPEPPGSNPLPEGTAGLSGPCPAPDPDWDEYLAWREREIAAGRDEKPPAPWETEGPAVSLSLGDATDIDPALIAAICGPDGLGGDALGPQFGQDAAADVLHPGPVLASLTEQAAQDLSRLTDNQLIGTLQAARRLENRAYYLQTRAIAEFSLRRTGQIEAATARGVPAGCREGEFPGVELAAELLVSRRAAAQRIDAATDLATRLPWTLRGMSAGLIDAGRAEAIAVHTACLSPELAAQVDEILAPIAPEVRTETIARRAAALAMKLDPEAVRSHRERAKRVAQRVEVRRERSGNASLAGRELDAADALASKANVHATALRLRRAGMAGTLDRLRTAVFNDLLQGRNPFDRLAPGPEAPADDASTDRADEVPEAPVQEERADGAGAGDTARAPVPAVINLLVHAGSLFGWDTAPTQAGGLGLLDPGETRDIVRAASMHPRTRWCMTVIGHDGTAVAHGCAPGQHPWTPAVPPGPRAPAHPPPSPNRPGPDQAARFAELLRGLDITLEAIAKGTCDHRHAEDHYRPSRRLQHFVRARTVTCTGPGCQAQAFHADLDHTIPYAQGPTDECNLGPLCRTCHRAKQAPGWKVEQPEPGVFRWTLPSGRTHTTYPTSY